MSKLLYIESSPRKERSLSIDVAKTFLNTYAEAHPRDEIEKMDLWADPLPEFDGNILNAKYRILHGQEHTPAEAKAWKRVIKVFQRFSSADKYLFSLPMWNFGIPYKLKHFIDVITQPGLAFSFSPEKGYEGLVTGKPAVVVYARGGDYPNGVKSMDYQKTYLEMILGFIGFRDIHSITIDSTLSGEDIVERATASAKEAAKRIAKEF